MVRKKKNAFKVFEKKKELENILDFQETQEGLCHGVKILLDGFNEMYNNGGIERGTDISSLWHECCEIYHALGNYTLDDVKTLWGELHDYRGQTFFHRSGMLMSAYIRKVIQPWEEIILDCRDLEKPLDFVGYGMETGILRIKGDSGAQTGIYLNGGLVHIMGNAGPQVGQQMHNGHLIIDGEFKHGSLAADAQGGIIDINGDKPFDAPWTFGCVVNHKGSPNYWDYNWE